MRRGIHDGGRIGMSLDIRHRCQDISDNQSGRV